MTQETQNKQYTFTSVTAVALAMMRNIGTKGIIFLPCKMGETLKDVDNRRNQQDNSESMTNLIPIGHIATSLPRGTDYKIRSIGCETLDDFDWIDYDRDFYEYFDDDNASKKNEYVWVRVDDVLTELGLEFGPEILSNPDFIEALINKINNQKMKILQSLGQKTTSVVLTYLQEQTIQALLNSEYSKFILNLVARIGKTVIVLDYVRRFAEAKKRKMVIIIASKSLGSNVSFSEDYIKFGYTEDMFILKEISLHINEDKFKTNGALHKELKALIGDMDCIIVTDEADFGSHTEDAIKKLITIKNKYKLNIVNQIAMSSTGISKIAKLMKAV